MESLQRMGMKRAIGVGCKGLPKPLEELKGKDLSIPRNPILAKLFRMVKLAENAGYGLDNIEHNWNEYNGTSVHYLIDFDSTIVNLRTQIDELPPKYPPKYHTSSIEVIGLITIIEGEMSRLEIQNAIGLKDAKHLRENYLEPAIAAGLVQMKYPNSPNHPKQKYLLTEEGLILKTNKE